MKVTITGVNEFLGITERHEEVDWDIVSIKEVYIRKFNTTRWDVRIERGKRAIVVSSGAFDTITVQDEETGRYIFKYSRDRQTGEETVDERIVLRR